MRPPELDGSLVKLRTLAPYYAPKCVEWLHDYDVVKYSEQRYRLHDLGRQKKYIQSFSESLSNRLWGIFIVRDDRLIGTISATTNLYNQVANLGIMVGDKSVWGKGFGTEAWKMAMEWLLTRNTVRKVEAGCMANNQGMLHIFNKSGMKIEATIKDHFLFNGTPVDMILAGKFK